MTNINFNYILKKFALKKLSAHLIQTGNFLLAGSTLEDAEKTSEFIEYKNALEFLNEFNQMSIDNNYNPHSELDAYWTEVYAKENFDMQ